MESPGAASVTSMGSWEFIQAKNKESFGSYISALNSKELILFNNKGPLGYKLSTFNIDSRKESKAITFQGEVTTNFQQLKQGLIIFGGENESNSGFFTFDSESRRIKKIM